MSCNFSLKSCLWFQIELSLHTRLILKSRVWFQTKFTPLTPLVKLLVFTVTPSKIKINDNFQNLRHMKWGWYRKTHAKIQVSVIFHTQNILRNCLPKIIERFLWRRHVDAHLDGNQHGNRKLTETSVTEFCY